MSAVSAPFGFRPAYNPIGLERAKAYTIASAYNTQISKGQPVILNTNGTVTAGGAAADLLGIFAGVEYIDSNTGKPVVSTFWPANQAATNIRAWVWDDPNNVYEVQSDGSIAQTAIGDQADVSNATNVTGSAAIGGNVLSACTLSSTLAGGGAQAQFRIVGFGTQVDNLAGDAFTIVQVQIARHQFISNKVAV